MASGIYTSTCMCSASSFSSNKASFFTLSISAIPNLKHQKFCFSSWNSQLGPSPFSLWNGLRHMGILISRQSIKLDRKGKCKSKGVYASLFGVGAPEALVIGVVALLVFGPKGLAEVARNLGKTLRAFQPTIKELQEVSREFKSTLEREIGLDDIRSPMQSTYHSTSTQTSNTSSIATSEGSQASDPNGFASPSSTRAYSSEDYLKVTEEQLKASMALQQSQAASPDRSQLDPPTKSQDTVQEAASTAAPPPPKAESET